MPPTKITTELMEEMRKAARLPKFAIGKNDGHEWLVHLHWPFYLARVVESGSFFHFTVVPLDLMEPFHLYVGQGLFQPALEFLRQNAGRQATQYSVQVKPGAAMDHMWFGQGKTEFVIRTIEPRLIVAVTGEVAEHTPQIIPLDRCEDLNPFVEEAAEWLKDFHQ